MVAPKQPAPKSHEPKGLLSEFKFKQYDKIKKAQSQNFFQYTVIGASPENIGQYVKMMHSIKNVKYLEFGPINLGSLCEPIRKLKMGVRRSQVGGGVHLSRVVTFAAIRLRGLGFKPWQGQKFETSFLLHSHPSGGEGVSPVQGEAIRHQCMKPEYLSYMT